MNKKTILNLFAAAAALAIAGCSSSDGKETKPMSRLHSDGTKILNAENQEVLLKGVNLGGWMFHETWITLVGHTTAGQVYELAVSMGSETEASVLSVMREIGLSYGKDPAVVRVCPANGKEWYEGWTDDKNAYHKGFKQRYIETVGETKAAPFLQAVESLPDPLCDDTDAGLRALLEKRFGPDGRDELLAAFRSEWIAERDIEWLAKQGFNVVRVPIGYRSLVTGPDSNKPQALNWNESALKELDRLLDWCEKYGVYAVIDIQEAPGGQNTYAGESGLYNDPLMQDLTVQMWETLSDRFIKRNSVAAYSLLAEPYGAPDVEARDKMYDRLVKAIRAKGDDHLCVIHDGFMGMKTLPEPSKYNWSGVVYSTHMFEWTARDYESYEWLINNFYSKVFSEAQAKQNVPYYIGSFSTKFDEDWAYQSAGLMVSWMSEKGYSWSLWTYKRLDDPLITKIYNLTTAWGLRGKINGTFNRPDPYKDDMETLKQKFKAYRNYGLEPNVKTLCRLLTPDNCLR